MLYINPYGLLNLSANNISDNDPVTIRKAKAGLFRQIDLTINENNTIGHTEYNGIHLTKADCIKIIDDLDNKEKREFHFFIYQNKYLNDFLTNFSFSFFDNYKAESIYKLPAFLDFISPFFHKPYNKLLSESFEKWNAFKASKILSIAPIVNASNVEKCYSKLLNFLSSIIKEIKDATAKLKSNNQLINSDVCYDIYSLIVSRIKPDLINLLPREYFQSSINSLADSIQHHAVIIHNIEYDKSNSDKTKSFAACYNIIEVAKNLDCTGLEEKKVRENYFILKKHNENIVDSIAFESKNLLLNKYSQLSNLIATKINDIENKSTMPEVVKTWLDSEINIAEINLLDKTFRVTKNEIALLLKSLSISIWNNHDNIDISLFTISTALSIHVDEETKSKLLNANSQLNDLKTKIERQRESNRQRLTAYKPKEKSGYGILVGIVVIILIIYLISNSNSSRNDNYNSGLYTPNNNSYTPTVVADTTTKNINPLPLSNKNSSTENNYLAERTYEKVSMKNGNFSSCSGIAPKFDYSINNKIIISAQLTDAAVKIINYETDKCIRFVFINDGTTYTVKNIPEDKYYLKIAYGNDWSVREGDPICKGHFISHSSYKKDYSIYNFNKVYKKDRRVSIPYYTLKLYRTYLFDNTNNNSTENSISEAEFNN